MYTQLVEIFSEGVIVNPIPSYVKVRFCQNILMFLSYLQTVELFIFLSLKIWILATENCLKIKDVFIFESLEAW